MPSISQWNAQRDSQGPLVDYVSSASQGQPTHRSHVLLGGSGQLPLRVARKAWGETPAPINSCQLLECLHIKGLWLAFVSFVKHLSLLLWLCFLLHFQIHFFSLCKEYCSPSWRIKAVKPSEEKGFVWTYTTQYRWSKTKVQRYSFLRRVIFLYRRNSIILFSKWECSDVEESILRL